MFLNLFQLVLHLHHDVLHFSLIGLRACGVDFATHLLSDETEFLSLSGGICHRLTEILQVVSQTLFLLTDVQFLNIIDEFLFQTVLVVLRLRNLLQPVNNTGADFLDTALLIRFDGRQELFDVVNLLTEFLLQCSTFLRTEVNQMLQGFFDTSTNSIPLLVSQNLDFRLGQHIGHTGQCLHPIHTLSNTMTISEALQLLIVVLHQGHIQRSSFGSCIFLNPHSHFHLTTDNTLSYHLAYLHLFFTIEGSNTGGEVQLL